MDMCENAVRVVPDGVARMTERVGHTAVSGSV